MHVLDAILLHGFSILSSTLVLQVMQLSGVDQEYPDEAYEAAPFAFEHGQLWRLKNEKDRFLGAGEIGQVSW